MALCSCWRYQSLGTIRPINSQKVSLIFHITCPSNWPILSSRYSYNICTQRFNSESFMLTESMDIATILLWRSHNLHLRTKQSPRILGINTLKVYHIQTFTSNKMLALSKDCAWNCRYVVLLTNIRFLEELTFNIAHAPTRRRSRSRYCEHFHCDWRPELSAAYVFYLTTKFNDNDQLRKHFWYDLYGIIRVA